MDEHAFPPTGFAVAWFSCTYFAFVLCKEFVVAGFFLPSLFVICKIGWYQYGCTLSTRLEWEVFRIISLAKNLIALLVFNYILSTFHIHQIISKLSRLSPIKWRQRFNMTIAVDMDKGQQKVNATAYVTTEGAVPIMYARIFTIIIFGTRHYNHANSRSFVVFQHLNISCQRGKK